MDSNILKVHIENAVFWLTEVACNTDDTPVGAKGRAMPIRHWKGAIRGEYHAATGEWTVSALSGIPDRRSKHLFLQLKLWKNRSFLKQGDIVRSFF